MNALRDNTIAGFVYGAFLGSTLSLGVKAISSQKKTSNLLIFLPALAAATYCAIKNNDHTIERPAQNLIYSVATVGAVKIALSLLLDHKLSHAAEITLIAIGFFAFAQKDIPKAARAFPLSFTCIMGANFIHPLHLSPQNELALLITLCCAFTLFNRYYTHLPQNIIDFCQSQGAKEQKSAAT